MFATPEQLTAANKATMEAVLTLANAAFASTERITALNFDTARAIVEDSIANANALLSAKNLQEFFNAQSSLTQPALDKAVGYSRSLYEIAAEGKQQFGEIVEAQFAEANKSVSGALGNMAKSGPTATNAAVAALMSAFAAATSGYDAMTKAAKQAADIAESAINATAKTAPKARKAA